MRALVELDRNFARWVRARVLNKYCEFERETGSNKTNWFTRGFVVHHHHTADMCTRSRGPYNNLLFLLRNNNKYFGYLKIETI